MRTTATHSGLTIALLPADGPLLSGEQGALDIIGDIYEADPDVVAIPVARFPPETWALASRLLGGFTQKLVQYGRRPAFVGDLTVEIAASTALRDYVRECNRRRDVLFATDEDDLLRLLG